MIANSTNISARMFRTQRFVVLMILSMFIVMLLITGFGAHSHIKKNNPEFYNKASDKFSEYYDTAVNTFMGDQNQYDLEQATEMKEDQEAEAAKAAASEGADLKNSIEASELKDATEEAVAKDPTEETDIKDTTEETGAKDPFTEDKELTAEVI